MSVSESKQLKKRQLLSVGLSGLVFFASPFFYLSRLFTFFSLFPLLVLHVHRGLRTGAAAVFVGAAVVTLFLGWMQGLFFLATIGIPAIWIPQLILVGKRSVRTSLGTTWLVVLGLLTVLLLTLARGQGVSLAQWANTQVSTWVDQWLGTDTGGLAALEKMGMTIDDLKKQVLHDMPSFVAIFILLSLWFNFLLVCRLVPTLFAKPLQEMRDFRAPDFWVWPTLAASFAMILGKDPILIGVADNFLRVFLSLYALQGFAVFTGIFNRWKLSGFLRTVGFALLAWPMLPLLLAIGFFDQWFDFRKKIRQS